MKHFFTAAAVLAIASTAFAGLNYKVQSSSTGLQNTTIVGTVSVEGSHLRMDVTKGDNTLFKDNDIVLSNDGGRTMSVLNPSTHNYFDLQLDQLLGAGGSLLQSFGGLVKMSFNNPHVEVRDGGAGGTIEGYPTHKYVLDAAYDLAIDAMGQKITSHFTMNTETWTTEQLSSEMSTFIQARGLRTGVEAIDRLIEAQSNGLHGFPLKQVSTVHVAQSGNDMTMVTTSSVTDIQRRTIDPSQFTMPADYTKVDDPFTRLMKQLKQ
jgi:hypothetical protein